ARARAAARIAGARAARGAPRAAEHARGRLSDRSAPRRAFRVPAAGYAGRRDERHERGRRMATRMRFLLLSGVAGAVLAYLFDPVSGRRRRSFLRERPRVVARRGRRRGERMRRRGTATLYGMSRRATHLREARKPQPNDATLAHKVESEVFRHPE